MGFFSTSLEERVEELEAEINAIDEQLRLRGDRLKQEADEHAALRRQFDSLIGY